MARNDSERAWPFGVGDRVVCNGDWGVFICDLRTYEEKHPGTVYIVHAVSDEGRWLSLRNPHGHIFGSRLGKRAGEDPAPGYGPSYFVAAPAALPEEENA